ncbi:unnamed protein product [Allacma fusca]|uniref:USP domain-containing protein n=1 Tax=Allacma fusca TaxID=39272 RepID=A0A8J2JBY2_9HEXA|nr:unnamed protein product [Allacma fusca]
MKFKNFLLSCSPGVHRKRLEDSQESKYANLRPISKRTSVPDFALSSGNSASSNSKHSKSKNKSVLKQSNSTSNFYVNSAGLDEPFVETKSVFEPSPIVVPSSEDKNSSGLKIGDRIIWAREETGRSEAGVVKWLGVIHGEQIAGIEFDNPLNLGSGWYENKQLFPCMRHHGGLVAVAGLMLEQDYFSMTSGPSKKSSVKRQSENIALFYPPGPSKVTGASPAVAPSSHGDFEPVMQNFTDLSLNNSRNPKLWAPPIAHSMPRYPFVKEPLKEEDAERFSGRGKGIQGNRNSCYLDATLFSMFSFTGVFDYILMRKYEPQDKLAVGVQKILRDDIVNTLRKDLFCPSPNVMALREAMHHLDDKLTTAEMDPQEFLQILFKDVLQLDEFIKLSSKESDYFHQVLVQHNENDRGEVPSIQYLFEQSLINQELKLTEIPSPALLLQMPRSGNKYKMYSGIFPNLTIDITDLMENTPRTCVICGKLATLECSKCYDRFTSDNKMNRSGQALPIISGAESTAYCESCIELLHTKSNKVQAHRQYFQRINYTFDTASYFQTPQLISLNTNSMNPSRSGYLARPDAAIPRVTMDLVAVICIETSHFVSFVKCGTDRTSPWAFFDSMADRVENINGTGQNIPQVKLLPAFGVWLDQLERDQENLKSSLDTLTPEMRRF